MMNVNKYRCLLNLNHILGCKKIALPSAHKERLTASHAGFATSFLKRAKQKHFSSNKNVKKDLQEGELSNSESKNISQSGENTTASKGLESSGNEINDRKTEKNQTQGIADFIIKNIMTFPLHVTAEETESEDLNYKNLTSVNYIPSVSVILQQTMSTEARKKLELWKQNMMKELGEEKFFVLQKATLNRGSKFHGLLKQYLQGELDTNVVVDKEVEGCWESVKTVLPEISDVKAVECGILHPHLHYKGYVDCVASYRNVPHVIEWKQSEKPKKDLSSTFDAPVQLCAYMGALSWCKNLDLATPVTNGLVVVAYIDGSPADAFEMDLDFCQSYWEQWLRRVQQFWISRSVSLRPAAG